MKKLIPFALLALLAGCDVGPPPIGAQTGIQTGAPIGTQTGAELYQANCAACHAADGRGGAMLDAPDLTGLTARNNGVFPAAYIMSQVDGFTRDATHGAMPEFGELLGGEVESWTDENGVPTPTPRALMQLAAYLETVQAAG